MNDNVLKFQKRKAPKEPRGPQPWLRRLMFFLAVAAAFVAAYAYFAITGSPA